MVERFFIMLKITIEIFPYGSKKHKRKIGEINIVNDGSAESPDTGNYEVTLHKSPEYSAKPGVWKKGKVKNFLRKKLGPYDLLFRALQNTVSYRNKS